jgi:hypothetical protein
MQNEIEEFKERFTEIEAKVYPLIDTYFNAQDEIMAREDFEDARQVDFVYERLYVPKEPIDFLYAPLISSLKELSEHTQPCFLLLKDLLSYRRRYPLSTEKTVTDMYDAVKSWMTFLVDFTQICVIRYRQADTSFRKSMHEIFAERPDLIAWFTKHLRAQEEAEYPDEIFKSAKEKLDKLMPEFEFWSVMIGQYNDDLSKDQDSYGDDLLRQAGYCCAFSDLKEFVHELRGVTDAFNRCLQSIAFSEKFIKQLDMLDGYVDTLSRCVHAFCEEMNHLAGQYEKNKENVSALLRKFMGEWLNPNHGDPLKASAGVMWEANRADVAQQVLQNEIDAHFMPGRRRTI